MKIKDALLAYSEWLDGEGLIRSDQTCSTEHPEQDVWHGEHAHVDMRPHDQLAQDFIEHWGSLEGAEPLEPKLPEPDGNCGFADGVLHMHVDACWRAGYLSRVAEDIRSGR